jgi:hypothetical protein
MKVHGKGICPEFRMLYSISMLASFLVGEMPKTEACGAEKHP